VNAAAPALAEGALGDLAQRFVAVMGLVRRLSRRYDDRLMEQLVYMPTVAETMLASNSGLDDWLGELSGRLNADLGVSDSYHLERVPATEEHPEALRMERRTHGIANERYLPLEFFRGSDYRRMRELGEQLDGLLGADAYVQRGEKRHPVTSFRQALEWLMEEAKRGQHIQRYKGLGEMNPDQLWETTMDPATRRLLRVNIEDAVGSDQIFTTLMGDQVEPRRDFIEKNALTVENLDV
jgi:DNA gyrase subunit B